MSRWASRLIIYLKFNCLFQSYIETVTSLAQCWFIFHRWIPPVPPALRKYPVNWRPVSFSRLPVSQAGFAPYSLFRSSVLFILLTTNNSTILRTPTESYFQLNSKHLCIRARLINFYYWISMSPARPTPFHELQNTIGEQIPIDKQKRPLLTNPYYTILGTGLNDRQLFWLQFAGLTVCATYRAVAAQLPGGSKSAPTTGVASGGCQLTFRDLACQGHY